MDHQEVARVGAFVSVPSGTGQLSCFCACSTRHSTTLRQVSPSENMCANLGWPRFHLREGNPRSSWHQPPPTQQHRGIDWGQTCKPSVPIWLTSSEALRTSKASGLHLPPPCREGAAQGLSQVERETEARGLRGKVITLKSLSRWVLHHSQGK